MCGIVGYVGKQHCIDKIINGLESLEYRGYDSAGIAYKKQDKIIIKKAKGKIENFKKILNTNEESYLGIGHTRWATHGKPCKENSHPHSVGKVTLVHNGIIENYEELKKELKEYKFCSETDSEVVAALIDKLYKSEKNMVNVLNKLKDYLIGSYALGIILEGDDNLYVIRKDSPLIIGVADDGNFIASDVPAVLKYTNKYYLLLNNECAILTPYDVTIYSEKNKQIKELLAFDGKIDAAMKNGYEHFMLKEIYEQPKVLKDTINEYLKDNCFFMKKLKGFEKYTGIDIVGCGSAYHVGMVGGSLISKYGNIPVNEYIASEYRYNKHFYTKNHLIIVISQSGETADTLAVVRKAKEDGIETLAIVNVIGSSIAREADEVMYIKAGPEISVATTKAYTCQLVILSLIAAYLGIKKNFIDEKILDDFRIISNLIENLLTNIEEEKEIAKILSKKNDVYYLGRKIDYASCLEASLKLKEISYIHSEAYAAGELKHGTISLIEENTPVISIITDDSIRLKTLSNVKEVCARGAYSIIITNEDILDKSLYKNLLVIPNVSDFIECIVVIIKCQLIAYYTAVYKNCDVDKPRNLAKSVTVE